ncbi:DgyrCDS14172 [Dimorphilus gyrociliatus]|uniref:DgyrCDS14172 n=1 Tax=Dimorphilus gyrociliatus TaxID=2664684 RepID=A0A7I8WD36_9ANNE|nr:DgyrCDS14172 [Dimorphilus gyrociliatus]
MLCCGPKLSACGMVLGLWGVIMLTFLGIFFQIESPALAEDLPVEEEELLKDDVGKYMSGLYKQASANCFIAAVVYVGVLCFSFVSYKLSDRMAYLKP